MPAPTAVGVDNGGTWIRFKGLSDSGHVVWSLKAKSPSIDQLPQIIRKTLKPFEGRVKHLALGSRGVWKQDKRRFLRRELLGLSKSLVVMSDVEAAWVSSFRREGIVVIAGTGSIAYGKKGDGTTARAGGLGPEKGDEGSGYWIGKEWLRRNEGARARAKSMGVRQIAQKTPLVIRKAKSHHALAGLIVKEAQRHLALLIVEVVHKLKWKESIPLSVWGSVLTNDWFLKGFLKELRKENIPFHLTTGPQDVARSLASICFPRSRLTRV